MRIIQTYYSGYRFRSRTEARYAVFFDNMDEQWEYEKEGFDLDEGDLYLPDFWLPRLNCHVEIKGRRPTDAEIRKCRKLQFFTGQDVAIFHGLPNEHDGIHFGWTENRGGSFTERPAVWTIDDGLLSISDFPNGECDWIDRAANAARQARFEHGEMPPSRAYSNIVRYEDIQF